MSRDEAIEILYDMRDEYNLFGDEEEATRYHVLSWAIQDMKAAQSKTCEGCKHSGKWEYEVECGYSSPCTLCKRRVADNYER